MARPLGKAARLVALASSSLVACAACIAAGACSSSTNGAAVIVSPGPDGAQESDASAADSAPPSDAGVDAKPNGVCEGACKTTSLVTDFGGKQRTLTRTQFGTEPGDGGIVLHLESYAGGDPKCPEQGSPDPDYTFIVSQVPRGATGKVTDRDGVTSAFFDFKGDLALPPFTKAISVDVTAFAEDVASPPGWVAFDVQAFFREGSVKGHVYATYCASMSR